MKKKKIYFHIGNHKTATSSVQYFFFKKKNFLYKRNYLYAAQDNFNNNNISWEAINHFYFRKDKQNIKDLFLLIKNNKSFNILLSSENLENLKYNSKYENFLKKIRKTHKIKIIWTIREQYSYLMSLTSMLINKGAYVKNFDNLVKELKKGKLSFKPYIFWFDYYEQLKKICKEYNVSNKDIYLITYSKNKNMFNEFCKILNIRIKINKNQFILNKSNRLFNNQKNIKNYMKHFFKISNNKLNKDITTSNTLFFTINNKFKLNFTEIDFKPIKDELLKFFKKKNTQLFKKLKIDAKNIAEFYGD